MIYEVELPDEATDGLFRGQVYGRATKANGTPGRRFLIATFTAPTWRHVQDEVRAICTAYGTSRTFVFDAHGDLVPKDTL